jgi:hypothetical protein
MNEKIRTLSASALLALALSGPVSANHDSGLGKSQDGRGQVGSVAVAPEPSTFWLFTAGVAAVGIAVRRRRRAE